MSFWDWNNYIWYVKTKEHTFGSWTIDGRWCIALTKAEKLRKIQEILELKNPQENLYADLLKTMLLREDHFSNGSFERRFAGEDEGCFECRSVIL